MTQHRPIPLPLARPAEIAAPAPARLLLGNWHRVLAAALLAALLGAVYAYHWAQPVYRTHVTLMLEPQEANVIDVGRVLPSLGRDEAVLNTQADVIRARGLVGRLVDRLGLASDPEFTAAARHQAAPSLAGALRARLGLGAAPPRRVLSDRDAAINALIRGLDVTVAPESLVFAVSVGTSAPEKSARIVNTLADMYLDEQVEAKLSATDQATVWLTDRVIELRRALQDAEARARAARSELGANRESDLAEMERGLEALRLRLAAPGVSQTEARALQARADRLETRLRAATAQQVAVDQMEREAEATALLYESFLARLKETSIQNDVHRADARILSRAVVPLHPAWPKPLVIVAMAAILGAGAGALCVLAAEAWRRRVRSAEDAEAATGLRVLATLPEHPDRRRDPLEEITYRPEGPLAGAVRDLRSSLQLASLDKARRVVLVTSTEAGEGKSTAALLLAESFASWGRSVLLIDTDSRGGGVSGMLRLDEGPGLMAVLAQLRPFEEVRQRPAGRGFDLLPAEANALTTADVFATDRFAAFLREMRGRYDHIVIDAAAVLESAEPRAIAALADSVVYLLRWNRTTRGRLRRGLAQLHDYGLSVTGLVLTRQPIRRRRGRRAR